MKSFFLKYILSISVFVAFQAVSYFGVLPVLAVSSVNSNLQTKIDDANQQIILLNQKIAEYQTEISQAGADKKTLQAAIKALDLQRDKVKTQVAVTQNQINSTQFQLQQLGIQVKDTKQSIVVYQNAIAKSLLVMNESDSQPIIVQLFLSGSFSEFWQNIDEIFKVQDAFQKKNQELRVKKSVLADKQNTVQQKENTLSEQKKSFALQQQALNVTVKTKSQLLAETSSKESTYQKLLAEAKSQLKSFSNFTKNAGGSQLLTNQTVCDAWGCYYNQRDASWGKESLNGTAYTLASDGCLVTSMAMMMTHYGYRDVTPETINSDPANFAAYFPAFLLYTISVDGKTATRIATVVDKALAAKTPVIVGMNVSGGTHFIVLVSGSGGNYIMRDPYIASGKDIDFSSHYNLKEIYSVTKVVISS